jgi:uncharacterized YigZ family protein
MTMDAGGMTAEPDSRLVPAGEGRSEIRERASLFLGFSLPASSEEEARAAIARLEKEFHDATHVCYAWRLGGSPRAADAGEPAGTAGKPILGSIDALGLDDVLVAVVRYFGGTKLGMAGLVRCYRQAAREALAASGRNVIFATDDFEVDASYAQVASVKRLVAPPDVVLLDESFGDRARFRLRVRRSRRDDVVKRWEDERIVFRPLPR